MADSGTYPLWDATEPPALSCDDVNLRRFNRIMGDRGPLGTGWRHVGRKWPLRR